MNEGIYGSSCDSCSLKHNILLCGDWCGKKLGQQESNECGLQRHPVAQRSHYILREDMSSLTY